MLHCDRRNRAHDLRGGGRLTLIVDFPTFSLFNPVDYLISKFRWSFYGTSDVGVGASLGMTLGFFAVGVAPVVWIFMTGYRLRS